MMYNMATPKISSDAIQRILEQFDKFQPATSAQLYLPFHSKILVNAYSIACVFGAKIQADLHQFYQLQFIKLL